MRRLALLSTALMAALLGACAAADQDEKLALVCQLKKCDCVRGSVFALESQPVVWKQDGAASCPEGYHLRKSSEDWSRV